MICLRCGYCCKESITTIVLSIKRGWVADNIATYDGRHGNGKIVCPHLKGTGPGNYYCACHTEDWYKKYSPCSRYNEDRFKKDEICADGLKYMERIKQITELSCFFMKRQILVNGE
jgi:hypothetical protein